QQQDWCQREQEQPDQRQQKRKVELPDGAPPRATARRRFKRDFVGWQDARGHALALPCETSGQARRDPPGSCPGRQAGAVRVGITALSLSRSFLSLLRPIRPTIAFHSLSVFFSTSFAGNWPT